MAWHHLQYPLGLTRLGHDAYFVEDSDDYPSCYDPSRDIMGTDPTYGLQFTRRIFEKIGLGNRWAYYDAHTSRWVGPCADRILNLCATADLLINLGGVNPLRPWLIEIPARAFVDLDPVFKQVRHLTDPVARTFALQHTAFLSYGENIGLRQCTAPNDGFPWRPTRQPVVLDVWPVKRAPTYGKFTTVTLWDHRSLEHDGRYYGTKADSFGPYMHLPEQARRLFELAVGGTEAPRELLRSKGWEVCNPLEPTRNPWTYQRYIQQSKAEFSVAKHTYVSTRCGWFSDRSAAYLASGRPVVVQETGFSDWLQAGSGVIPFNTPEQALAGIEELESRYQFHCRAARSVAEEYFDACKVLTHLLECAMNPASMPI